MAEITMPRLSDTMSEGTVGRWLKQPGDMVKTGDIIAEIETDKATMELEAFENGTLQQILVPEGQTVPIGQTIGIIGNGPAPANGSAPAAPTSAAPAQEERAPAPAGSGAPTEEGGSEAVARTTQEAVEQTGGTPSIAAPAPTSSGNGQIDGERVKASPVARRLAEGYGIDLNHVQGTGPGGRIIKDNVEEFRQKSGSTPAPAQAPVQAPAPASAPAPAQAPAPAPAGQVTPMSRMRRAIARKMTESKPGIPHIYITNEIDMGEVMKLRKQINDSGASEVKISVNDMVIKAAAKALRKFPSLNSSYAETDGQPGVQAHDQINISVAVAISDGLIAPTVTDADKKSLGTIAAEVRDLASRGREGKIKPNELEGGTFQVSNLGMFDVVEFVSIISAPQSASISVGAVREVPVVRDGQLAVGQMMHVTISVDHRVTDGATAAQYLQELKRLLQSPMSLLV